MLRFPVALVGAFVALYLLVRLHSSAVLAVAEWSIGFEGGSWREQLVALLGAGVGAALFAVRDARDRRSLERLWTFVLGTHVLAYLLLVPYFHVTELRGGAAAIQDVTVSATAYHAIGYGLLLVALLGAYGLVYRRAGAAVSASLRT